MVRVDEIIVRIGKVCERHCLSEQWRSNGSPLRAAVCYRQCIPTVHADRCTGCGMCEKSCVLPKAAIKVLPARLARATAADHYRKGWEEQDENGAPLVDGLIDLPDRLPGPGTDNLATPGGFEPAFTLPGASQ